MAGSSSNKSTLKSGGGGGGKRRSLKSRSSPHEKKRGTPQKTRNPDLISKDISHINNSKNKSQEANEEEEEEEDSICDSLIESRFENEEILMGAILYLDHGLVNPTHFLPIYEIGFRKLVSSSSSVSKKSKMKCLLDLTGELMVRLTTLDDESIFTKWRFNQLVKKLKESRGGSSSHHYYLTTMYRKFVAYNPKLETESGIRESKMKRMDISQSPLYETVLLQMKKKVSKKRKGSPLPHFHSFSISNHKKQKMNSIQSIQQILISGSSLDLVHYLISHEDSREAQEIFSINLYNLLFNEFIQCPENASSLNTSSKVQLLTNIYRLEEYLQEGIPVVGRFLGEYFKYIWDGETCFLELFRLISFIQITEYSEIHDCLFVPLKNVYSKSSTMKKLACLSYFKKLILFWVNLEFERFESSIQGIFPRANTNCYNILESVHALIHFFNTLVILGLEPNSSYKSVYLQQCLLSYKVIIECLIDKEMPIFVNIPSYLCYFTMSESTPISPDILCSVILRLHSELIPICQSYAQEKQSDKNIESHVVKLNIGEMNYFTKVIKDVLAVLSDGTVHLDRESSLFKGRYWDIEDERYRQQLSLSMHMAFSSFTKRFVTNLADRDNINEEDIYEDINEEGSDVYENHLRYFDTEFPHIAEFIRCFTTVRSGGKSMRSIVSSIATSGISSMVSSKVQNKRNMNRK